MKTYSFKLSFIMMLATISVNAIAQSPLSKKTCIKIDEITNGKIIKIDTCFIGMNEAEIQKQLKAMGITDVQDISGGIDSLKWNMNSEAGSTDSTRNEVIIVNDDKNGEPNNEDVKIISGKDGICNMVVVGKNGDAYTSSTFNDGNPGQAEVIIKKSRGDSSETKIYIYKKIEVQNLSDSDKLKGRNGVSTVNSSFSNLEIYPNPAEAALTISYSSSSSLPLLINICDENGKTVYKEKIKEPGQQVNHVISLSAFTPGVYFVTLVQGNQNETRKIIVK